MAVVVLGGVVMGTWMGVSVVCLQVEHPPWF